MKKYIFLLFITLFAIILLGTYEPKNTAQETALEVPVINSTEPINKTSASFIARDLDGYIAIFVPYEVLPCLVTDINVKTLPLSEQEQLKAGISIDDNYALAKFIEDYSS